MSDTRRRRRPGRRILIALGLAVGIPACGGGSTPTAAPTPPPPPPTTLTPTRFADLSATATSPDADTRFNCRNDVRAKVTVTNQGATSVRVTGVRNTSAITSGHCSGAAEFTFRPLASFVPANSTAVVLDQALYQGGSGCCAGAGCSGICGVEEKFDVVSELGEVPAGSFTYAITFKNCPTCSSAAASSTPGCVRLE